MSKYNNKKVRLDGYVFDSTAEAKHYWYTLKPRLKRGEITNLELQPIMRVEIRGKLICKYIADFRYFDSSKVCPDGQQGCRVVEDVKGMSTAVYRLKKKLVEATHPGTKIIEINGNDYRRLKIPCQL